MNHMIELKTLIHTTYSITLLTIRNEYLERGVIRITVLAVSAIRCKSHLCLLLSNCVFSFLQRSSKLKIYITPLDLGSWPTLKREREREKKDCWLWRAHDISNKWSIHVAMEKTFPCVVYLVHHDVPYSSIRKTTFSLKFLCNNNEVNEHPFF